MARGKQLPHIGGDFEAAPEAPSSFELGVADDVYATYALDPEPRAFWEMLKRMHPKEFAQILLNYAIPLKGRAERAAQPTAHTRLAPISPIRPGIVDVPSDT
jgi:hypothetical protein